MRQVAGTLRLDLAQYRELAAFAQFGSDLDPGTKARLDRGQRATEVLKQPENEPLSLVQEVTILFALSRGLLDDIPVDRVGDFETGLQQFMGASHPEIGEAIARDLQITDETERALRDAINEFKRSSQFS